MSISDQVFNEHKNVLYLSKKILSSSSVKLYKLLKSTIKKNKKIYVIGNGGSATDAMHFVAEMNGKFKRKSRKSFPFISLVDNTSSITAIANDYGYKKIFSRQISGLGQKQDVLIAISTSGKSPNILEAIRQAKKIGIKVILLTGIKKSKISKTLMEINIPSKQTARIQEIHILFLHIICEMFE